MTEFFIDTADVSEIQKARRLGIFSGCTTNPKIILTSMGAIPYEQGVKEILAIAPDWPVSLEVTTTDPDQMIEEAKKYTSYGSNVVIKLPTTANGLYTLSKLNNDGVKTNLTLGMTAGQGLMTALGGATYFSLFYCRMRDGGEDPQKVIRRTRDLFDRIGSNTKIIAGSIRCVDDVIGAAEAGAHIVTITPKVVNEMLYHPQTEKSEQEFLASWREYQERQKSQGSQ